MLLVTMFCYLFYYTGRQNWGFVVQALEDDLGLDKVQAGWIAGAMLAAYGVGQFINGNLGDKFGGRRMLSLGAVLSVVSGLDHQLRLFVLDAANPLDAKRLCAIAGLGARQPADLELVGAAVNGPRPLAFLCSVPPVPRCSCLCCASSFCKPA